MSSKVVSAKACSKVILAGEHSVVYGGKALAVPLRNWSTTIEISDQNFIEARALYPQLLEECFLESQKLFPSFPPPKTWRLLSNHLPMGAGLGSSAAFCIALLRAMFLWTEAAYDQEQLAQLGNQLEARFHGRPSGLDTAVISYELPIVFTQKQKPSILTFAKKTWNFFLLDSSERSKTSDMVAIASPFFQKGSHKLVYAFDQVVDLLQKGLERGVYDSVTEAINEASMLLASISVVTSRMEHMMDLSKKIGLPAMKPTGAGGGGCLLGLYPEDPKEKAFLQTKMKETFPFSSLWDIPIFTLGET